MCKVMALTFLQFLNILLVYHISTRSRSMATEDDYEPAISAIDYINEMRSTLGIARSYPSSLLLSHQTLSLVCVSLINDTGFNIQSKIVFMSAFA